MTGVLGLMPASVCEIDQKGRTVMSGGGHSIPWSSSTLGLMPEGGVFSMPMNQALPGLMPGGACSTFEQYVW